MLQVYAAIASIKMPMRLIKTSTRAIKMPIPSIKMSTEAIKCPIFSINGTVASIKMPTEAIKRTIPGKFCPKCGRPPLPRPTACWTRFPQGLALAKVFRAEGITGWRRQVKITVGRSRGDETQTLRPAQKKKIRVSSRRLLRVRPDFVFSKLRLAVFVDGCFWHACPLHATRPKGNAAFWRKKLAANQKRDRKVNRVLKRAGWRVLRLWEHELALKNRSRLLRRLHRAVT